MEYKAPTIEYTHPTGAGGYAQAYPTPVAGHNGYAPPSNVPPASPPGYQHMAPAPASAPNSIHIHNNQQLSSPMGSPASGWQQPVLSPASDATSPYPQYSPGSHDGSSYGSAPSNVASSMSSASANYQNYCNAPPPTLPDKLGNYNNQQSQGSESWVKQDQNTPRTNVEKDPEVVRREKIAEYKAAKLMQKTFETAEQYRGYGGRPVVRPPPAQKIVETRPPALYPDDAEMDKAPGDIKEEKGDLETRREKIALRKAAKLLEKNFGGGYAEPYTSGGEGGRAVGGESAAPRPVIQDDEAAARRAFAAKKQAEAENFRKLEEHRARQRAEQEKLKKKNAGKEKMAETTRKIKTTPGGDQFEMMHDLKCTYDREREAWAQNMALGLLDFHSKRGVESEFA